ncbi:MAG: redox-sensing transcriptional repressor Rex [Sedimentisphaerales bacterium]|nr:redox-sensing transcriptional repressor Rex [Sedimentisphaerales bacterium]
MRYRKIPSETIRRLPMYLRAISFLQQQAREYVSSQDLADQLHLKSPQIRKDFSYFGAFGVKGTGYHVDTLIGRIRDILKLSSIQKAALIGAGRLGKALALYPGFGMYGFEIVEIFDSSPQKIGKKIGNTKIKSINDLGDMEEQGIRLAILAVPSEAAQEVADRLVESGIRGILNMAPCYITVPKRVRVQTIDIAMELGILPYYV